MQNTTNAFLDGIITDLNPLTIPETALTSALNATIVTGNGNEGLLQNDMGNTLIKDSITGGIMSINDGFIPLGMKEHGGILYIASYNPKTKKGELGSIPSPIIHYDFTGSGKGNTATYKISDKHDDDNNEDLLLSDRLNSDTIFVLSDLIFHPGDKFIVVLDLDLESLTQVKPGLKLSKSSESEDLESIPYVTKRYIYDNKSIQIHEYPQITRFDKIDETNYCKNRGWFKIELYAVLNTGKEIRLDDIEETPQMYYNNDGVENMSSYWFLEQNDVKNLDEIATRTQDLFRTYPNIPAGRLGIKFVPEYPSDVEFGYNASFDSNLPQVMVVRTQKEGTDEYEENPKKYIIIPSLTFTADCPIMPDKIKVTCNNGDIPVYIMNGSNSDINEIIVASRTDEADFYKDDDSSTLPFGSDSICRNKKTRGRRHKNAWLSIILDPTDSKKSKYIISKYENGEQYLETNNPRDPIYNYTEDDCDGLFYIEVERLDIDLEFTCYLYTKIFKQEEIQQEEKNLEPEYILYKILAMPKFNPANVSIGSTGEMEYDEVRQVFDWKINNEFDIELFKDQKQKAFIYDENNIIMKYDVDSHKYIERTVEEGNSLDEFKNFQTYIYPQYACNTTANMSNKGFTRFIWDLIFYGPRIFPDKESFENAPNSVSWAPNHLTSPVDIVLKLSDSDIKGYDDFWNWFIVSSVKPQIKINNNLYPFVLPIIRPSQDSNVDIDAYLRVNTIRIFNEARRLRNHFKSKTNEGGLIASDLPNSLLFKTNLKTCKEIPQLDPQQINFYIASEGGTTAVGFEQYFNLEMNLYPSLHLGKEIQEYDNYQGLTYHINRINNVFGDSENAQKDYRFGKIDQNGLTFLDYCAWPGSSMNNLLKNLDERGIHDIYYSCLVDTDRYVYNIRTGNGCTYKDVGLTNKDYVYTEGFITEAMKKCPGYIPADKKFHTIINTNILNYNYGINYLYGDAYDLQITNIGDSPIIPTWSYNQAIIDFDTSRHWENAVTGGNLMRPKLTGPDVQNIKGTVDLTLGNQNKQITLFDKLLSKNNDWTDIIVGSSNMSNYRKETIKTTDAKYPFIVKGKVNYTYNYDKASSNERNLYYSEWQKVIKDNLAMIISPLIFIKKPNALNNISNYSLTRLIALVPNAGFYITGRTKEQTNLGDTIIETTPNRTLSDIFKIDYYHGGHEMDSSLKTPEELGLYNTFCNDRRFIKINSRNITHVTMTSKNRYSMQKGWYVGCLTYNEQCIPTVKISIGKLENEIKNNVHFFIFYLANHTDTGIKLEIKSSQECIIGGFGIYKLKTTSAEWAHAGTMFDDLVEKDKLNKDTLLTYSDYPNLYNYVVFKKEVACFVEKLQKDKDGNYKLLGCLEREYSGFLYLPEYPSDECVFTYCLSLDDKASVCHLIQRYSAEGNVSDWIQNNYINKIELKSIRQKYE